MSSNLVPPEKRIDRSQLERIIRRAAELQARERDLGDGLSEHELLELGSEVGIPARHLKQAMLEETTRSISMDTGLLTRILGPRLLVAERAVKGDRAGIEQLLTHVMTHEELLVVKRRFPDRMTWEPRQDMFASLRRSLRLSGRKYMLARAREMSGGVTELEPGTCHVRLTADLSNTRRNYAAGAVTLAGGSATMTTIGLVLGVALPVALLPLPVGLLLSYIAARARRPELESVQVAMEQILDRLERGEIRPDTATGASDNPLRRIAEEIRKNIKTQF